MRQKKLGYSILLLLIIALLPLFLTSCSKKDSGTEIYFLNFKPEIADVYTKVVKPAFEKENPGYTLKIETAASNQYASTLKAELAKSKPPVIFQTNGPVGLISNLDDVADISSSSFYSLLRDKSMALKTPDGVIVAVPYAMEGFGIIYNDKIMSDYIALPSALISSVDEINNFGTLKAVVEDMTSKKDQLGIKGVFASTSMAPGNEWRWQTHLFNVPLYVEMLERANGEDPIYYGLETSTLDFTYNENFKNLFDLYINNSTTAKGLLGGKSVDDSMAEFALGQAAMVQNGNWGASQILGVPGNTVEEEDIKFLPLYMGLDGEENFGLSIGTENYLAINKNASKEAQEGADVFLTWLFSSPTGKKIVTEELGFITPFSTFTEDEVPNDPLAREVTLWMSKKDVSSLPWEFAAIPSIQWKNDFGAALLEYINGTKTWNDVVKVAQSSWAKESKEAKR